MQLLLQAGFCGIFMELYVYKMVKNNKADEKQSRRPSPLVMVMLYVSPGVSASGRLDSDKNDRAHPFFSDCMSPFSRVCFTLR